MASEGIMEGVHRVPMGNANAFLLEDGDALALIDAGDPGHEEDVWTAIRTIGRSPARLEHLIFTHHHLDHIGSAAALVRQTGARTYMHAADIPVAESGGPFRPLRPAPGLMARLMVRLFYDPGRRAEPIVIDQALADGDVLPFGGGIEVIHCPGHCSGQVALLWRRKRMLFVGDVCMNVLGLRDPVGFEDIEAGRESQRRLATLAFDAVGFGHGAPIGKAASQRFRRKWGRGLSQPSGPAETID